MPTGSSTIRQDMPLSGAPPMSPTPDDGVSEDLRRAFRIAASSVWIVTSAHDRIPVGFTAISIASVSVDPALISFNIGRRSSSLPTLSRSRRFAAHLLSAGQDLLARRFAATTSERFADESTWQWDPDGIPELNGVVARLSGSVTSLVETGDSLLAVAEVRHCVIGDGTPLLHHNRSYLPLPSTSAL